MFIFIVISLIGCDAKDNLKTIIPQTIIPKTITLKTSGYVVEFDPDKANILIQLNCIDKNIMTAKNCLIKKSDQLNTSLIKYGIQEQDISTTEVDLEKDFVRKNDSNVFNGYKTSTSLNVKVRDLEMLKGLYSELSRISQNKE